MISVIIPSYNRAAFLERALNSVFQQTLAPGEIVAVDDGSTDDTPSLLQKMATRAAAPLCVIRQENKGAAAARNAGIKAAKGELLAFLDADDWWQPQKLALQAGALQKSACLLSHTREIWFRGPARVYQKKKHDPPGGRIFLRCLPMCVVGMSTVLAKRELFTRYGLFDEKLPCCEDYELWLRVACREAFLLIPEALTCKDGGRPDQLSAIYRQGMDKYRIYALQKLIDNGGLTAEQEQAAREELARKCRIYGLGCIKHDKKTEGGRYLALAERYRPSCP